MMAADGQNYCAHGAITIADIKGKVLQSTSAGTEHATRLAATAMPAGSPAGQ